MLEMHRRCLFFNLLARPRLCLQGIGLVLSVATGGRLRPMSSTASGRATGSDATRGGHMNDRAWMVVWAVSSVLILAPAQVSAAFDDVEFCGEMKGFSERAKQDVGVMVDAVTRNDGTAVLCGLRVIDFKKFSTAPTTAYREGWRARKERQWSETSCQYFSAALKAGWTISQTLTFIDGARVVLYCDPNARDAR